MVILDQKHTPTEVVANVSRIVTRVIDRLTGDRSDYPLLVALACKHALKNHGIQSRILYGSVAWLEVLENHSILWAGTWGDHFGFWVETELDEVVDLNVSVAHRKKDHNNPDHRPLYSPPMLWSQEVPKFYRYKPEGVAEVAGLGSRDENWLKLALEEINLKCTPEALLKDHQDFPNEPMICSGRKLLDDTIQSFRHYDRALSVMGIPSSPF